MKRHLKLLTLPFLLFSSIVFLLGLSDFSEEDLHCEEAAAKLRNCCPTLDIESLSCYTARGCDGDTVQSPVLRLAESHCIEDLSCDELALLGVCRRIAARQTRIDEDDVVSYDEEVCP